MKVILKQDHELLGDEGQVVDVKDGYARNFLIPNGIAVQASASNIRNYEEIRRQRRKKIEKQIEESKSVAERLASLVLSIPMKAGEEGRIFGSVTSQMIHDALVEKGIDTVDKKKIVLKEAIKSLGEHAIDVKLQHSVVAILKVNVVDESETPEAEAVEETASEEAEEQQA